MKLTHTEGPGPILRSRFARGLFPLVAALLAFALAAPEARAAYTTTVPSSLVNLTGTGTASTTGNIHNNEGPARAFDGNTAGTRVIWNQKANIDLVYEFPSPTRVNAFRIWRSDQCERHPKTFRFEGLDDAGEWQRLDGEENLNKDTDWKPVSYRYYQFANPDHFTKYRLFIEANCGNQYTEFLELEMFCVDDGTPTIATHSISANSATSLDVSVTMGAYAAETVVVKAIDASGAVAASADLGAMSAGAAASGTISGLTTGSTYLLRVDSGAGGLADHAPIGTFYTGTFTLSDVVNAQEAGCVPGSVTVSRAAADPFPLTVNYSFVSDDAVEGVDYEAPSGSVVIPAGSISSEVYVKPILNMQKGADVTIAVALASGDYVLVGNESAQVTIVNAVIPSDRNVWIAGASSDGLASTASNWSKGKPSASNPDTLVILVSGDYSSADMTWDPTPENGLATTVASWTQTNDYTGVITLKTVYPGKGEFQCLTVTGPMAVMSGKITHPQSRTQWQSADDYLQDLLDNETYRIRIDAGSLTVGANGRIDARNKGYYHANTGNHTSPPPSHGGWFGVSGLAPYDNIKEPIHIGMPYKRDTGTYTVGIGGGAVYLTSPGTIVVNGYIGADTGSDTWNRGYTLRGGAAAGSVYVRGASVTGTGTISASALSTSEQNNRGVGGRVAVISTSSTPVDYTTLSIKATVYPFNNNNGQSTTYGSCGTVFVKDATQTYGTLLLQNVDGFFAPTIARCTPVTAEGDWTFDAIGLGNRAVLSVPVGTELHLPNGLGSVFSLNAAGSAAYGSIRYEGGTLDLGSAANQTMAGNWMLTPWTNMTLNANVVVKDEAAIGVPAMADILDSGSSLPAFVSCNLTVNGDLTVESDGLLLAKQCGLKKDKNSLNNGFSGVLPGHTHGGRCLAYKYKGAQFFTGYDSVFAPRLPGNSVPWPNGQSAEASGGVIRLVVAGALTLNGEANVNGMLEVYKDGGNCSGGTGGSIDITAGTISGTGRVVAEAGSKQAVRGSAGRIAVKLTSPGADFSSFSGTISASGRVLGSGGPADSSAGTVYLQTAADGEKGGTVYIAMSAGNQAANNTNTTEMVSLGYGGDAVDDYKKVKYVVRDYGRAAVNADMKAASIEIADANSSLDLEGHALKVKEFLYPKTGGGLAKLSPGTYTAAQLRGKEITCVVDTSDGAGGSLVVTGGGFHLRVR